MGNEIFGAPMLGGVSFGLIITINLIVIRYVLHYIRETREEYVKKLTQAIIELAYQKTENMRLQLELEKIKLLTRFRR